MDTGCHAGADFTKPWGKAITLKDRRAWDLYPNNRPLIQEDHTTAGTEGWFRFDICISYDEFLVVADAAAQKLLKNNTSRAPQNCSRRKKN